MGRGLVRALVFGMGLSIPLGIAAYRSFPRYHETASSEVRTETKENNESREQQSDGNRYEYSPPSIRLKDKLKAYQRMAIENECYDGAVYSCSYSSPSILRPGRQSRTIEAVITKVSNGTWVKDEDPDPSSIIKIMMDRLFNSEESLVGVENYTSWKSGRGEEECMKFAEYNLLCFDPSNGILTQLRMDIKVGDDSDIRCQLGLINTKRCASKGSIKSLTW